MSLRLTLHRTRSLEVTLKPGSDRVFAFDVELSLGSLHSRIDPDSGMLVNLTQVDRWLKFQCDSIGLNAVTSLHHLVRSSADTLENLISLENATKDLFIERLVFHEKRGEFFGCGRSKSRNLAKTRTFAGARDLFCGRKVFIETGEGVQWVTQTFSCDMWKEEDERTHQVPSLNFSKQAMTAKDLASYFDARTLDLVFAQNPSLLKLQFEHALSRVEKSFQK